MPLETEGLEALRNDIARMAGILLPQSRSTSR